MFRVFAYMGAYKSAYTSQRIHALGGVLSNDEAQSAWPWRRGARREELREVRALELRGFLELAERLGAGRVLLVADEDEVVAVSFEGEEVVDGVVLSKGLAEDNCIAARAEERRDVMFVVFDGRAEREVAGGGFQGEGHGKFAGVVGPELEFDADACRDA